MAQLSALEQEDLLFRRSLLGEIALGRDELEAALDAERRTLSRINENRLTSFERASSSWKQRWSHLNREIASLPLSRAHLLLVEGAEKLLPEEPDV